MEKKYIAFREEVEAKQNKLTFDDAPKDTSNPVTSRGIKTAIDAKADAATVNTELGKKALASALTEHTGKVTGNPHKVTATDVDAYTKKEVDAKLDTKADASALSAKADASALSAKADATALTAHTNSKGNPHGVTMAQIGISFGTSRPSKLEDGQLYIVYSVPAADAAVAEGPM